MNGNKNIQLRIRENRHLIASLRRMAGHGKSNQALIEDAITLYSWAVKEKASGGKIVSIKEGEVIEFTTKGLEVAALRSKE